jgi:serine/threonine protein kinase/tetratricopeptide (TPR) repeat protein
VTSGRHERLEQIFDAALGITSHEERDRFLDTECDDPELRAEVEQLLDVHSNVGTFLEVTPVNPLASPSDAGDDAIGTVIGRYRIIQKIGDGGFGAVYMAEQRQPVRRTVALKILKPGMDSEQVIARFEAERQALALMDHPNIARVIDAGTTEQGRPFFVMELVRGPSITDYCDQHTLTLRERVGLLMHVCLAVQHAHQKGVIHRDLKPNNVLVAEDEDTPVPKVIDFGIAKATSSRLTDRTLVTEFRQFLGTPEYMSPDQADPGASDVDTRTDVYSLGVLLYELVTGTTPFDSAELRRASYADIQRTIREVEPPKPSSRLLTLATRDRKAADAPARAEDIARLRRTDTGALRRAVRGDLDWIIVKAMEKDRSRRYATAKDLADDLERYLEDRAVDAGPPSTSYNFRKFVRRHRLGVITGSLVAAALVAGLSLASVGLVQANRARDILQIERDDADEARALAERTAVLANRQAAKAALLNDFLRSMLRAVDPTKAMGREVSVRFILDEAADAIADGALADHPEAEASLRMTLGETYHALGLYPAAQEQIQVAQGMFREHLGQDHAETLRADYALARVLRVLGRFADAEGLLRRTLETQRTTLGEDHEQTTDTMAELALALWGPGRYAEAEPLHRRIYEIRRRLHGPRHAETLTSMGNLGMVCRALGKTAEAEDLLRRAHIACREVFGMDHPATARAMYNLGLLLEDLTQYDGAESLYRDTYQVDRRIFGPDHPETLAPMNSLVRVLLLRGKIEEMRPLIVERLSHLRRATQRPDADALTFHAYAWELLTCEPIDLRDPVPALPAAQRAVEIDQGHDANMLRTLAVAYEQNGDLDSAIETQRSAIAQARAGGPYNRAELERRLVDLLVAKGDFVGLAGISWDRLASGLGGTISTDSSLGDSLVLQSEDLLSQGRYDDAAALLRGCLAMREKALPQGHWLIADARSRLAEAFVGAGQYQEAETLLLEAHGQMDLDRRTPPERRRQNMQRLVRLYDEWDRPGTADEWRTLLEDPTAVDGP